MTDEVRRQLLVALAAGCVFFTALGGSYLWDEDEPKNAECAREMLAAGEWIVPQFNYQLRTDKPILLYWLMLAAYHTFGVGEFAARFWSATFAVGTSLLTYHLGRKLYSPQAGLWAGLATASCLMFSVSGRAATPDSTLVFCTTAAFYAFVHFGGVQNGVLRRGGYLALYGTMGFAVLAKGPVGVVLPGGVLGLFLLCRRERSLTTSASFAKPAWHRLLTVVGRTLSPRALVEVAWSLRPFTALVVVALIALPWYVAVGLRTDGEWLVGFFGRHNLDRFTGSLENHRGPFYYYLVAVLVGFFPWSCFLPPAVWRLVQRMRGEPSSADTPPSAKTSTNKTSTSAAASVRGADLFLACWAGAYLVFFTLARTKLPSYVLPCYPALAVLTGKFFAEWCERSDVVSTRWFRAALYLPAIVGLVLVVCFPIAATYVAPGEGWLGLVGLVPIVGIGLAARAYHRQRRELVPIAFAATAVAFLTTLVAGAGGRISQLSTSPAVAEAMHATAGPDAHLIGFRHFDPTLPFYARGQVPLLQHPEEVRAALAANPRACIVTRGEHLDDLHKAFDAPPTIVGRYRRFLRRSGELVVVAPPTVAATAAASQTLR